MARKHVVIVVVTGGVVSTIAGGATVAMALHKNSVISSVGGETHNISVREDTIRQILKKNGVTIDEYDVVAPSLDTRVTDSVEVNVLYDRQLQPTIGDEAHTVWTAFRTIGDTLTQLNLNGPDSKLSTSRSAAIGCEGLSFNISAPESVAVNATGIPVEL